uniref:Nuclease n=1 Tax=Bosea sp. NBC_00436 TaxID=2969620 RepID=A0A9E8CRB0_9HYPH
MKSLLAIVIFSAFAAAPARAASGCAPDDAAATVQLTGLDPAGDPLLSDGRRLRLIGLAPRQSLEEVSRFDAGLRGFVGQPLGLSILGEVDRWGRLPARLSMPSPAPDGPMRDLAELLLQQGAALPLPEPGSSPCKTPQKPAVQKTVTSATQVSPLTAVDGHDLAAVKAQEGRYVMLEGRIASVGERSQRTYLNFSRRPKEAASIVLSRSLWRELKSAGWTASHLGGKRLRAYGVLSGRDGLLLEVASRTALELID